jgi:tetratricopeptide (TPR) repeat protein
VFERKIAKLRRRARKAYEKAHTLYGRLSGLPAFSKYPKAAQALLESGWVAGQLAALLVSKRKTTRRKALLTKQRHAIMRLLKNYPRSQHIPQAYYVFAHTLFRQKAFSKAVAVLSKVTQYRRAPVAPYAACLLGRVYLALNNHVKALSQFVKVARRKGLRPEVRRTALLGVVKSYVRVGRPDKAYAFFLRCHHKPDVRTTKIMLRLLAALYRAAHKNRQAETILRVLSRR